MCIGFGHESRFDESIILLLLQCLLGSLLGTLLVSLLTETDKASIVPGCLQAAAHVGGLLLGSDLATLLLHRCGHMGHGLAGKRLLDSGGLVSGSILHPSILDLLGTTWEDNQVSLVIAEALDVSLQPLNRAVATAVVHCNAEGLCLELSNVGRLDLGEREHDQHGSLCCTSLWCHGQLGGQHQKLGEARWIEPSCYVQSGG